MATLHQDGASSKQTHVATFRRGALVIAAGIERRDDGDRLVIRALFRKCTTGPVVWFTVGQARHLAKKILEVLP